MSVLVAVLVVVAASVVWVFVSMGVWIGDRRPEGWQPRPERQPREISGVEMSLFEVTAPGLSAQHRQREQINDYAWVSRDEDIVRIPIERAMELYLERQTDQEAP